MNATRGRVDAPDSGWLIPAAGLLVIAAFSAVLGSERLTMVLVALLGVTVVSLRPEWGVATLLSLLMMQYGTRRFERTGMSWITSLIPAGEGLLTVNNLLGLYLAVLLVYQVYRDGDWSFLKSRQVQLAALIAAVLIFSGVVNGVDYAEQVALGLRVTAEDPARTLISRVVFLVLCAAFMRGPRQLRLMVAVYVLLVLVTAYSGSTAALTKASDVPQAAEYRAGGLGVLIETAGNPNRLAMIVTLALVFVWEYSQASRRPGLRWAAVAAALFLVLTVFLTASRGGVIGMAVTSLLLFARGRNLPRRVVYGAVLAALTVVLVIQVVPEENIERLSNIPLLTEDTVGEGGGSIERRGYTYGMALQIWLTKPVMGVGLGNWELMRFTIDPLHSAAVPHNSYMLALAEGGIVTLGLYLLLFGVTVHRLGELERRPGVVEQMRRDGVDWLLSSTRIGILALMVFSLFGDLWELIFFYFLFGLAASLLLTYGEAPRRYA